MPEISRFFGTVMPSGARYFPDFVSKTMPGDS